MFNDLCNVDFETGQESEDEFFECVDCHKVFSKGHALFCTICGYPVCPSHVKICVACKALLCDSHAVFSKSHNEIFCIDCKRKIENA